MQLNRAHSTRTQTIRWYSAKTYKIMACNTLDNKSFADKYIAHSLIPRSPPSNYKHLSHRSKSGTNMFGDDELIVRLIARNLETCRAWAYAYKDSRYRGPRPWSGSNADISEEGEEDWEQKFDTKPTLHLNFGYWPKDLSQGFIFGSNPELCDIDCGKERPSFHICDQAFRINLSRKNGVILEHLSPCTSTTVQYSNQTPGTRKVFRWILFPATKIIVRVADMLEFEVVVPMYDQLIYQTKYRAYFESAASATARFRGLGMESNTHLRSPRTAPTVKEPPFYYHVPYSSLGRGPYGKVFLVRDVSTGLFYAAKQFHKESVWSQIENLTHLRHVSYKSPYRLHGLIRYPDPSRLLRGTTT